MVGDIFFDVLWLNGCAGSLLFFMWTVRKPADIFDVTEINGCFRTGSVAAFYSIIQQVEKYTAEFRRTGMLDFSGKKDFVGNFDIFLHGKKSFVRKDGVDQAVLTDGVVNVPSENHR